MFCFLNVHFCYLELISNKRYAFCYRMAFVSSMVVVLQMELKMDWIFVIFANTSQIYLTGAYKQINLVRFVYCFKFLNVCQILINQNIIKRHSKLNLFNLLVVIWKINCSSSMLCFQGCEEESPKLWIIGTVIACLAAMLCVGIAFLIYKKKSRYENDNH